MKRHEEQMWEAYLDGELSAGEAAAFEASLSDEDRRRSAADMGFERALADRLSENATCPDAVWEQTRTLIDQRRRTTSASKRPRRRWYLGVGTLAAAASLAFVMSLFAPKGALHDSSSVILAASSVADLREQSEIDPGVDAAQRYLDREGLDLDLNEAKARELLRGHHHSLEVVGARQGLLNGQPLTEVFLGCCGYPVTLLLADQYSAAAREIGLAAAQESDIQATRVVDGYFTAVVARHPVHGMLDIFE